VICKIENQESSIIICDNNNKHGRQFGRIRETTWVARK